MRKPPPEQKICLVGLSSSLNWQNVLPLYFYNVLFPGHINVPTYIKAKQVWKKWFILGAGGSEVCGTLHLNISRLKIGSVDK